MSHQSKRVVGRRVGRALVAAAMVVPLASVVGASTVYQSWYGVNGNWSDPTKWDAFYGQYQGTFPNNTETVTQDAVLQAGTATLDGNYTINYLGLYQSAAINGAGDLTVLTGFDWYGGYLYGTGALNIGAGVTLAMPAAAVGNSNSRTIARPVNNYGTANYDGGYLAINGGGSFNNYGTFNAAAASGISKSNGTGVFNNAGTFNKTGTTEFRVTTNVVNSGAFNVNAGTVRLETVNNNAGGNINVAAGASLSFEGNVTGAAGSTVSGPGTITFFAGTHTFEAGTFLPTGVVNFTGGTITLNNAFTPAGLGTVGGTVYFNADQSFEDLTQTGLIRGTGTLTLTNTFTWNKGIQYDGTTVIGPGAHGTIAVGTGDAASLYSNRTVNNQGTLEHTAGAFGMNLGATLNNSGVYKASSDTGISRSAGTSTFNNGGTFIKTGTGTYTINSRYFNTGTTEVQAGTLVLNWNSSNSGAINVAAGANLEMAYDTTYAAGSTIVGAGNVLFSYGTHDLSSATYAATGTFRIGGSAGVTIANAISPAGTVVVGVGKSTPHVTFTTDQTFADVDLYGYLHGAGNVTITNHLNWGGYMDGAGKTTIAAGATADFDEAARSLARTVDNFGTVNYAQGTFYINNGGVLNNYGTVNASSAGGFPRGSGNAFVNNYDTFNKTDATTFVVQSTFNNQPGAVVNVNGGTLQLNNGGTNGGTINLAAGVTLLLSAAYTYSPGSMIAGAGNVTFGSGTHVLAADTFFPTGVLTVANSANVTVNNVVTLAGLGPVGGTLNLNADETFADVALSGTIGGTGSVAVTNSFNWTGGTLAAGGMVTLRAGTNNTMSDQAHTLARTLVNYGTLSHTGGNFTFNNGGMFNNYGTFTTTATTFNRNSGTNAINNSGTFTKDGTSALAISVPFNNAGGGKFYVNAGSAEFSGSGNTNDGTITVAGGASLKVNGQFTYGSGSSITGPGAVWFSYGTHNFPAGAYSATGPLTVDGTNPVVTFNGPIAPSSVAPLAGTLNFNADQTLSALTLLSSSTLGGTGNVTLTGGLTWNAGTLAAGGKVILPAGATGDLSANNGRTLNRVIESAGTINYAAGQINFNNGGIVNTGTFNATSSGGLTRTSGTASLTNSGTFNKSGTTTFVAGANVAFNNAAGGVVNVDGGTLELNGGGANGGAFHVAGGAVLRFSGGYAHEAGAVVDGAGTVEFTGGTHVFPVDAFQPAGVVRFLGSSSVTINNVISPASIDPIVGAVAFNADQAFNSLDLLNYSNLGGGGNITINDVLAFQGGTLSGSGLLTVGLGGTADLTGTGSRTISRNVDLYGVTNYADGTLGLAGTGVTINNFGTFNLGKNGIIRSAGSHVINNSGTFDSTAAAATISSDIVVNNTGTLSVSAGKLVLGSVPAQQSGSTLTGGNWVVRDGANLTFQAGAAITTNAANVSLYGADSKFDKINGLATNNGTLALFDGRSFTTAGAFANNAYLVVTGSNMTVSGAFSNSAQVVAQLGGTLTTNGLVTSTGNVTVADNSTFTVKSGINQSGGVLTVGGAVVHAGGTSLVNASQRWSDGSTLNVTGGWLTLASDAGGYFPNPTLAVSVGGTGKLQTSSTQRIKSLAIGDGGTFVQQAGGWSTLLTRSLTITGTGRLDVGDDKLIVDYDGAENTPVDVIREYIRDGRIVSSVAQADPQGRKGVAYAEASQLGVTSWGGLFIDPMSVVAMMTWYGDANFDGKVDGDDYALLDRGYARGLTGWINGDFNYDNVIDAADYLAIDRVVAQQSGTLSPALLALREQQFGSAYVSELITAVPEPVSVGLLMLAAPLASRRRRRQRLRPACRVRH